ncbi:MAG: LapA family protein [Fibrobacterota bacterium]
MWVVRWFVIVLVLVFVALFVTKNTGVDSNVKSIDFIIAESSDISVTTVIFLSYLLGFLTWFFVSIYNIFKLKIQVGTKDKIIKGLKKELNAQRNEGIISGKEDEYPPEDRKDAGNETMVINKKDLKDS